MTREEAMMATVDELRDWLAGEDGWHKPGTPMPLTGGWCVATAERQSFVYGHWWKAFPPHVVGERQSTTLMRVYNHPHPPTRDGAAAAMPEGWAWSRLLGFREWYGAKPDASGRIAGWGVTIPDTGDEIADRYRLAVLCRLAEREAAK